MKQLLRDVDTLLSTQSSFYWENGLKMPVH